MFKLTFIAVMSSAVNAAWTAAPTTCKDFAAGVNLAENNCSYFGCIKMDLALLATNPDLRTKCIDALTICSEGSQVVASKCPTDCDAQ